MLWKFPCNQIISDIRKLLCIDRQGKQIFIWENIFCRIGFIFIVELWQEINNTIFFSALINNRKYQIPTEEVAT